MGQRLELGGMQLAGRMEDTVDLGCTADCTDMEDEADRPLSASDISKHFSMCFYFHRLAISKTVEVLRLR